MTFIRRLIVLLSIAVIAWWAAAQFDLLRPQYHPVPVAERLLFDRLLPAVAERLAERDIALPPAPPLSAPVRPANTPLPPPTVAPPALPEPAPAAAVAAAPTPIPPTATAIPTPTAAPVPTPTPTAAPTPPPTAPPPPTLAAAAAPIPAATVAPSPPPPSPAVPPPTLAAPAQQHLAEKEYMLELINAARAQAGVPPVILGDNRAAQLHAAAALESCFTGHWGADGLKPYMRYSLAGGYQSNGENASGLNYCIRAEENYRPIGSIAREIREVMNGLLNSPGHRANILEPWHKKVNIGLAWDRYNFRAVQHFEGDYVDYSPRPTLENGFLSLAGTVKNGISFNDRQDLGIQVYYDPPPYPLTRGQLARTYCYGYGIQVAALRPPLAGNRFYLDQEFVKAQGQCPDPYQVPAEAPAPDSHDAAHRIAGAARSLNLPDLPVTGPWITASHWLAAGADFAVQADLSQVTARHGPGVYTVALWQRNLGGGGIVISEYAIFYGIDPPPGYGGP